MSLDDKFYPEDGSLLTAIDNSLVRLAGKIGEMYQHVTGNSYKNLARTCYKASAYGFLASATGMPIWALFSYFPLKKAEKRRFMTVLEEELEFSTYPIGKNYFRVAEKLGRLGNMTMAGLIGLYSYALFRNAHSAIGMYSSITSIAAGAFLAVEGFADYLSRANMPPPPEKSLAKKAIESVMQHLLPLPQPVPVRANAHY